jgi:flotillin
VINDLGIDNISQIKKGRDCQGGGRSDIAKAQARANEEANDARYCFRYAHAEQNNSLRIREAELQKVSDDKKSGGRCGVMKFKSRSSARPSRYVVPMQILPAEKKRRSWPSAKLRCRKKGWMRRSKKKADALKYEAEKQAEAELVKRQREGGRGHIRTGAGGGGTKGNCRSGKIQQEHARRRYPCGGRCGSRGHRAKAIAEAEGIDRKGGSQQKYGEAAVLEMAFKALPEISLRRLPRRWRTSIKLRCTATAIIPGWFPNRQYDHTGVRGHDIRVWVLT